MLLPHPPLPLFRARQLAACFSFTLAVWVEFWELLPYRDSGDVLGLFVEEQDSEENEKRRKKKKGTKRKRDGRGQEEGTLACDLKLDDMLDRTLEDGAKQHNLTAVNVRNILHVSKTGQLCNESGTFAWEAYKHTQETLGPCCVNY